MKDQIHIHRLEVRCRIGVPEAERRRAQKLHISVVMEGASFKAAAQGDDIDRTVNYFDVCQTIKQVAGARPRKLLETLGEDLARAILDGFRVDSVELEIQKFILPDTEWVGIRMARSRKRKGRK
jgi:FolB domain-containing protein